MGVEKTNGNGVKPPPGGVAPRPKAAPKPGATPSMPGDSVKLNGQIAPNAAAETGKIPGPGGKPADGVSRARDLMTQLFGFEIHDKNGVAGWLREQIAKNPDGNIDFHDPGFKRALAMEIYGSDDKKYADKITDEAVDYFFGNQDGKFDAGDGLILKDLIARLEFMVPVFTAQVGAGGDHAASYLGSNNIMIVNYREKMGCLNGVDFAGLSKANDPFFINCFKAALKAYLQKPDLSAKDKKEALEAWQKIENGEWDGKMPGGLKELLFAAYWGKFRVECGARNIKLPGKEMLDDILAGAFLNYIEGHSDKKDPTVITHDMPKGFDEDSVASAKKIRQEQVGAAREAAKKDQVPVEKRVDTTQ